MIPMQVKAGACTDFEDGERQGGQGGNGEKTAGKGGGAADFIGLWRVFDKAEDVLVMGTEGRFNRLLEFMAIRRFRRVDVDEIR